MAWKISDTSVHQWRAPVHTKPARALLGAISIAELMWMKASEQFPLTYRYTSWVAWGTEGHREAEHILTGSGGRSASVQEEFHARDHQHEGQEPPECDLSE